MPWSTQANRYPQVAPDDSPFALLPLNVRPIEDVGTSFLSLHPCRGQACRQLLLNLRGSASRYTARFERILAEARRRVVRSKRKPMFGSGRHHSIWFAHTLQGEVVYHHPNIGAPAVKSNLAHAERSARSIEPGRQALCRSLLITGRSVDLASKK